MEPPSISFVVQGSSHGSDLRALSHCRCLSGTAMVRASTERSPVHCIPTLSYLYAPAHRCQLMGQILEAAGQHQPSTKHQSSYLAMFGSMGARLSGLGVSSVRPKVSLRSLGVHGRCSLTGAYAGAECRRRIQAREAPYASHRGQPRPSADRTGCRSLRTPWVSSVNQR
jgi:hypothetical protein